MLGAFSIAIKFFLLKSWGRLGLQAQLDLGAQRLLSEFDLSVPELQVDLLAGRLSPANGF